MLESYQVGEMWETDDFKTKMKALPEDMQESFLQYLDGMYQQESEMMLRFIAESRRELNLTGQEIKAEQDALKLTSERLSSSRLSARPGSRNMASAGSSMDSVTFEVENKLAVERYMRRREQKKKDQEKGQRGGSGTSGGEYGAQPYPEPADDLDSDTEYKQEQQVIIDNMRTVSAKLDGERERQARLLEERKQAKKKKQEEREKVASGLVREASVVEEMKMKDKERQEQKLKEKLEAKKKKKEKKREENGEDGCDGEDKKKKKKKKNTIAPEDGEVAEEEGGEKDRKKKKKKKDKESAEADSVTLENEVEAAEKKKKRKKKDKDE